MAEELTLSLRTTEGPAPPPPAPADADDRFAWPTPPLPCYPAAVAQVEAEPCEIEGMNGRVMAARLILFDAEGELAQVQVPPARTTVTLRFGQFRRLTLTRPLGMLAPLDGDVPALLPPAQATPFRVDLLGAQPLQGRTIGHLESELGLFLFEPVGAQGAVRRSFVPRAAYGDAELGQRLGELLVEQQATTSEQVDQTLQEQQSLRNQKVGDILLTRQVLTPEQLIAALDQQAKMPMVRIGEALIALGFIDESQLAEALEQQRTDRSVPLGELLVRKGLVSRQDLQAALARKMGYPLVDVSSFPVEAEALTKVPYGICGRLLAMPLLLRGGRLIVALEDPSRRDAIDELEFASQLKVVPVLARTGTLTLAIDRAYEKLGVDVFLPRFGSEPLALDLGPSDDAGALLASLEQEHATGPSLDDDRQIEQSDNSLVRLINSMIVEAQAQGVSDIHVECQPGREKVRIRFRKDGVLRSYLELPHTYHNAMIARIKIMCDLDISERRKPQDGKINFGRFVPGKRLELRVATIPTNNGLEDAVLRLLASARPIPLDDLGLSPANLNAVKEVVQRPHGMLLCVGPTGSGKTTTLHSCMGYINVPERKIWTAEDPIEITQPGLRQVQMNPKIDWTFAKALRAFLRADPDVIMVGEIRDQETAQTAIEASLTGHLVLSTLHTNSAPETVTRLLDMGMDPFNFADSLLAVLAQRLVRKLCTYCRERRDLSAGEIDVTMAEYLHAFGDAGNRPSADDLLAEWRGRFGENGVLQHFHSPGCARCDGSGLRGRAGLHELLVVSRTLRRMIQTGSRADDLQRVALGEGMRTLRQDGIEKVLAGVTTIEEVRAGTGM